jgi:hypothetical protein
MRQLHPIRMFLHRSTVPPYSGRDFAGLVRSAWANSGTGGYDGRRRIRPAAAHLIFGAAPAMLRCAKRLAHSLLTDRLFLSCYLC